jgi:hypothetical protein
MLPSAERLGSLHLGVATKAAEIDFDEMSMTLSGSRSS